MRIRNILSLVPATLAVLAFGSLASAEQPETKEQLVKDVYPLLTTGMIMEARLTSLPAGVLLKAGSVEITTKDLDVEVAKAPESVRPQLVKNSFFLLEQVATRSLLNSGVTTWADKNKKKFDDNSPLLLTSYFDLLTDKIATTDAEVQEFYDKNKDMVGGASFEQVKNELKRYILQQKRQEAVDAHITSIGKRTTIDVDKAWVEKQYASAMDNPVNKARMSGKPSLVDFWADGCIPCDMMTPVLGSLTKEYEGKLNVLFVHVRKEQILAARYGIQTIPVQIFFDKDGKEIFRHTGFFPKDQIVAKLIEIGVK